MESTAAIRQKLHNYLEVADDKKIKAMYTIMEAEIEEVSAMTSVEFKKEINKRYAEYKQGDIKVTTAEESKIGISKILKADRKK